MVLRMREIDSTGDLWAIGRMCAEFGVTARTLRFYEAEELLFPVRRGQTRLFTMRDRARLKLILRGKRFGFSLSEIRELLELYDLGDEQVTQLTATRTRAVERLAAMEAQRAELDEAIEDLRAQIALIERLLVDKTAGRAAE
jgi:Predicted transcriptional regulators